MNLKFYLRGLGIGMAVTALLLHFAPKDAPEMSEKEIIERARELGMTEKVTLGDVVVDTDPQAPAPTVIILPKAENTPTPKATATPVPETTATPTAEPAKEATPTEKATATPTVKATATPTQAPTDTPTPEPTATSTPTPKPTSTPTPEPTATPKPTATATPAPTATATPTPTPKPTATPTPSPKPTATATPTPKPTAAATPTEAPAEDDGSPKSLNTSGVEISVTPGDSSYTVAKRLAEAGVVPSAAEFDEYLCKNGYDRKITTGMHTIPAHTSYRRIGEILSGKK